MTTILRSSQDFGGVAPITVSRVINNSGYISDQTRQKVEAAVSQLGYVPNTLSQSLRWKQTRMLALLLTDVTNPFWTTVARGVEDAASEAGYHVILCNTDELPDKQESYRAPCSKNGWTEFCSFQPATTWMIFNRRLNFRSAGGARSSLEATTRRPVRCNSEQGAYQLNPPAVGAWPSPDYPAHRAKRGCHRRRPFPGLSPRFTRSRAG